MGKKLFILLVVLMSLSLIGIIFVQTFFINNTLENEEKQFTLNVSRSLGLASRSLEDKEMREFNRNFSKMLAQGINPDSTNITALAFLNYDDATNETTLYQNSILEESFKVPSLFFDIGLDSVNISRITNQRKTTILQNNPAITDYSISPEKSIKEFRELSDVEKKQFEIAYRDQFKEYPIYKRITTEEVRDLLRYQFHNNGINLDFEFAIYDEDLATKVQSDDFEYYTPSTVGIPIFLDNDNNSDFTLYVNFPERKQYLMSSILGMMVLSILFTSIIILAYSGAIYQLIRQRQIAQIKTDFINNMTHEFKTPIATINLALDSIKNPKIINDTTKVLRYLQMIKDENTRMHAQVENVLRISQLDKNELNITKEGLDIHELVEDAMTHVELIVEDRQGYIKTHLNAANTSVLANESHFTNVLVNIMDNAVKYSTERPKIDVYTENVGNNVLIRIADQGNGMSKQVAKRVFEKFYREPKGDVHDVKGHGLGLAYVKRIVEDHHGHISVESEKGKGSVFTIKLPLIS
ncbi:two-component system, OmpR family, phosphate regulon sensor histidine kinase PhoR [Flavobacteriaceae bacterium MAR_2010_188]|nr:two-component system, OmpR family, phosphate regulon sensor histidine kinase PhoR [Flavobacteriaceae bacterium MAR_2010_188]